MRLPRLGCALVLTSLVIASSTACGGSDGGAGAGGDTGGPSTSSGPVVDPSCGTDPEKHSGEGTYYDATGAGNCSFDASPGDLMVGAMNHTDYANSAPCGACVRITGPDGSGPITVRIVDQCPECQPGDIDLSPMAFDMLAAHELGRVPIDWTYVACDPPGSITYHFKDGSNPYWTAVQIRNARYAIAKFEVKKEGAYQEIGRVDYNFFVDDSGMGAGPFEFRVTDVKGHVLEDSGIPLLDNADADGAGQFPKCEGD